MKKIVLFLVFASVCFGSCCELEDIPTIITEKRTVRINNVQFYFALVRGGTFLMGSPDTEEGRLNDERQHWVTISSDYYISVNEITQDQWKAVMGADNNPSLHQDEKAVLPLENVSWEALNSSDGFFAKINALGQGTFMLPTEAQWEYAARDGHMNIEDFLYSGGNDTVNVAWFDKNSEMQSHPVKNRTSNLLGLYDMSGNVAEFCRDHYAIYPDAPDQTQPVVDPLMLPAEGTKPVVRGGGFPSVADKVRVASRGDTPVYIRSGAVGFRIVMQIESTK